MTFCSVIFTNAFALDSAQNGLDDMVEYRLDCSDFAAGLHVTAI